jgi:hypothetical protein
MMKRILLTLMLVLSFSALAQRPALVSPVIRFSDSNGKPLAGGFLYSYAAGTTTPLQTYVDSTTGALNTNPVVLDSTGSATVFLGANVYKLVLQNSSHVQQWSADNIAQGMFQSSYVQSVFGRTGVVTAQTGDYSCSMITGAICSIPNLYNQTVQVSGTSATQRPILNFLPGVIGSIFTFSASGGTSYSTAPTVTFTGGGCTSEPTGGVSVSGGAVTNPVITFAGSGCTTPPTPGFSGGGGVGATGSTTLTPTGITCVDDPSHTSTDCTFAFGTGSGGGGGSCTLTDETASRSIGGIYQNTTTGIMYVSGFGLTSGSSVGSLYIAEGPSYPTITVFGQTATATIVGGNPGFFATILPGYYYQMTANGAVYGIEKWIEITGCGGGSSSGVSSFNTRTGAVTLSNADVASVGTLPNGINNCPLQNSSNLCLTISSSDQSATINSDISTIAGLTIPQGAIGFPDNAGAVTTYNLNGSLQDPSGANAVIVMPKLPNYTGQPAKITLRGYTDPPGIQTSTPAGAVLATTLNTAGANLIGGYDSATGGGYPNFTNVDLDISNLTILAPANPCATMVNAFNVLTAEITHVSVYTTTEALPSCTTGTGIVFPATDNNVRLVGDDIAVAGFYNGVVFGEHQHAGAIYEANNVNGFVFDSQNDSSNTVQADYLWCQGCTNFIVGEGSWPTWIRVTVGDSEGTTGYDCYDPGNVLYGDAYIHHSYGGVTVPTRSGCANLRLWSIDTGICYGATCPATGTVTHTAGALTLNQLMLGNGAADSKVDPDAGTDGAGNGSMVSLTTTGPCPLGGSGGCEGYAQATFPSAGTSGNNWLAGDASGLGQAIGTGTFSHFCTAANYSSVCPPGSTVTLQVNSVNNTSQTTLNDETSTTNITGLTITPSNPSGGIVKQEITGTVNLGNMSQLFVDNPQTSTYNAVTGDMLGCKTITVSSGTFTINLLSTVPLSGQCLQVINYGAGTITVSPNGHNLNGSSSSATIPPGSASAATGGYFHSDGAAYEGVWSGNLAGTYCALAGCTMTGSIQMASGQLYQWNGDTGLSRTGAGTVALGNGTAGSANGTFAAANFNAGTEFEALAQGTATSGANFGSGEMEFFASYWNGSAAAVDTWTCATSLATGSNPASTLACNWGGGDASGTFQVPALQVGTITSSTLAGTSGICASGASNALAQTGCIFKNASATASATPGTGVTSVTCATATCTNTRGTYTVVGGTATTGTIFSLSWTATATAYVCTATMNGGTGFLGIGNSLATTTGMNITAGVTVLGLTFNVNYSCQP